MKKTWIFVVLITLVAVLLATMNVTASSADAFRPKKTPFHVFGPQATDIAPGGNPHGNGNSQGQGNDNDNGNGNGNGGWFNFPGGHGKGDPSFTHTPRPTKGADDDQGGKGNKHGEENNYTGTIAAVDAGSLTLTLGDGSSVTFVINANTRIKIPTEGKSGSPSDLVVGERVVVRAFLDQTQTLTASMIMVVPGKPEIVHRVGTVTAYTPGSSITIQDHDGNLFTFIVTAETKILPPDLASTLGVGVRVTIIAPRDVTGGPLTAKGIVVHPAFTGGTGTPTATPTATSLATDTPTPTATDTATATPTDTETATP